ncbi:MAG: FemAB family XrtA/PEP-CTERM system-associated protein [Deltaproteobacteria bacterium]|nr:FemAB family XrtA/PEP-CTERM system-associated protein [Candidatus Deferrimicrobiaceae bacterium]
MKARIAGPGDIPGIDSFLRGSEASSAYHDYRWIGVVERSFGHACYYLVCRDPEGTTAGVLPLVHLKSRLFGNFLVSMPYFNYGGVCADRPAARDVLIDEAVRTARELEASHIEFRQEAPLGNGFPAKTRKVSMKLRLPGSGEELWKSFPSKLRSQIRKPQKEGMTVRISRHDELENFYRVFSINMRDLGTPVYPKQFFRNILDQFPGNSWICTVSAGKTPVASGFLVGYKERLEIPWASSLRRYNRLGPNMLLYWSCLESACERGFRIFDFGRSTAGESTYRFKEQWGAEPYTLHWHYWLAEGGALPEIHPDNPRYRFAIRVWKRIPVPLTRWIGPYIVRNIP